MKTQLVWLALFAVLAVRAIAGDYSSDVARWITVERPSARFSREYETFMHSANFSKSAWVASREGKHIVARLTADVKRKPEQPPFDLTAGEPKFGDPGMEADKRFLCVEDGWLVGYNAGEFGASLWWYSTDGKAHYKISDHQVNQFITTQHGIFAVEGLAHMCITQGSMIQLIQNGGRWTAKTFAALPESAEAIAVLPDDTFVVVTTNMLLRITPDRDICILVSNGDWGALYPNSIAVTPSGRIYIGMRQFVVAHDLSDKDKKLQFLLPNKSFLNVEK